MLPVQAKLEEKPALEDQKKDEEAAGQQQPEGTLLAEVQPFVEVDEPGNENINSQRKESKRQSEAVSKNPSPDAKLLSQTRSKGDYGALEDVEVKKAPIACSSSDDRLNALYSRMRVVLEAQKRKEEGWNTERTGMKQKMGDMEDRIKMLEAKLDEYGIDY